MSNPNQYMTALQRANEVRLFRASVKRRVAKGVLAAAEVLVDDDPRLAAMPVKDLLLAVPGMGVKRAHELLWRFHLRETITLERLSPSTREKLRLMLVAQRNARGKSARPQRRKAAA